MTLDDPVEHWSRGLAKRAETAEVPGAVLGIWADGEQIVAPYGVWACRRR